MIRITLVALIPLLAVAALASEASGGTTVILVRHAEKELSGGDVPLTEAGHQRARDLVAVVENAGVTVAIASRYRRTQMTLAPAVVALGLPAERVLERTEVSEVAAEILERQRGGTILVAGHSDTVPQIVAALGAPSPCPPFEVHAQHGCMLPDPEYDHLFVVMIPAEGAARVVHARFGAPSP